MINCRQSKQARGISFFKREFAGLAGSRFRDLHGAFFHRSRHLRPIHNALFGKAEDRGGKSMRVYLDEKDGAKDICSMAPHCVWLEMLSYWIVSSAVPQPATATVTEPVAPAFRRAKTIILSAPCAV